MRKRGFFDQYIKVVETGEPLDEEVLFPNLTSPGRWLHHVALKVGDGVAITTRDVTARKRSELALRESESRNRALIEAIPDLMFVIGRDGKYLDFHAPNSNLLLVSPDQFMGRNIEDVLPPYLFKHLRDRIEEAIMTDTPQTIEYRLNLPSGMTEFEARIVAHDIDKVLMIVRDITERKQAEQLAFDMEVERERTSMITKFIQTASHEFRTPLAIISTSVYLMEKNTDPAQRKVRAERIQEQVTNISHLVEALVLMAKLDSGKDLEISDTPIKPLIEQIAAEFEPRAKKQSHQFQVQLTLCNPNLEVDPHLLQIAIQNLLDNALRFTHPGGRVYLGLTCEQRQIQIIVSDNGAGIPPDSQPYIFERFYRLDEARSTQGFGLGLAIAKKIIELHNGTITFHSTQGEGSSFTITLPVTSGIDADENLQTNHPDNTGRSHDPEL
jgi:PAS domain S-box-containing protein